MKKKSTIFNLIILAVVTLVLLFYMIFVDGWENMVEALNKADYVWLVAAGSMMILYWLTEMISVYSIGKKLYAPLKFRHSVKTVMIGQLFNCITPFATGGQPMQAYYMTTRGVPAGIALLSLLARFLVYQVILTVYSVVAIFARLPDFTENISSIGYIVIIGFIVNSAVVVALVMVNFFPNFSKKATEFIINLGAKIRIIKNRDETLKKANEQIDVFYNNVREIKKYVSSLVVMSLVTVVQLTVYFLVPYFICISLGIKITVLDALFSSAFVHMVSSFVPLPGAAGGAEGGFYLFFNRYVPDSGVLATIIVLWRLMTFYMPIIFGAFFANRLRKMR